MENRIISDGEIMDELETKLYKILDRNLQVFYVKDAKTNKKRDEDKSGILCK